MNESSLRKTNIACALLFAFGLIQMLGYLINSRPLRGIGAAYMVSPMPKVFSDVDGLETFASEFTLLYTDSKGHTGSVPIDPELYSQLKGPYKRRNVYGAALSYAPRLPDDLWQSVYNYGFNGPLKTELSLPEGATNFRVQIKTKTARAR